ncbi:undecaprenyldiphospho-muramoylpentapeptide beta-N-acetylglucosaminyltransferase [Helicobacter sp. MIT 14-3879]|uniref:undecaprenyldiphospho-muramoylpentapeptide beta-N-acetylglucosaminyltransferase n=1 Tax=Helicobacter sp. MIT 14-3879 TaxID=2040649 RepID=UPI000E1EA1CA|nr:undecaprenyldiphospho-muramoylpentapeptide beta-N-acetylglucosaminyltransferase [Helicobacter sp. MIT 14-3879]RDU64683.1 undecaprenyldiphospho-muramoylpentapeptide beta-N-acetylglucosaminyltransferase [Helicobacter sp. MIT 14-3879]
MNLLITGGGTGGHLSIARTLAFECKNRGINVFYIGSTSGQDKLWFDNNENFTKTYFLNTTGIVNKKGVKKINALNLMLKAILESKKILKQNNINAVISVGGFSAGGGAIAAIINKIPLFIHEQNAIFGKLNSILSPFAKNVFSSFEIKSNKFIKTSYPINDEFFKYARKREQIKTILFLGGSQGAMAINDFAINLANDLLKRNIKIIHQCGINDFNRVKKEYQKMGLDSKISLFSFDNALINRMTEADFCVSRAGASSLWELCANNLPTFFIPYPFAAKNHQYFNALFLKKLNLCEVIEQKDLNKDIFLKYLDSINLRKISRGLSTIISANGAKQIIDKVLEKINDI